MRQYRIQLAAIFFIPSLLSTILAQNLVVNGDIEQDRCSNYWYPEDITGWIRYGTANHVHLDCTRSNGFEYTIPYEGSGALGFYAGGVKELAPFGLVPVREYVIGSLKETLIAGEDYSVSFWVKAGSVWDRPWENLTTDQLGMTFIQDTSQLDWRWETGEFNWMFEFEPLVKIDQGHITNFEDYIQIEACYTAQGWENQFIIGNFTNWEEDELISFWPPDKTIPVSTVLELGFVYFIIDNVEIKKMDDIHFEDMHLCNDDVIVINRNKYNYDELSVNGNQILDSISLTEENNYLIEASIGECNENTSFEVQYSECDHCDFYIPNVFSKRISNGNQKLSIESNCEIIIREAVIYNRWGNVVFDSSGHPDDEINLSSLDLKTGVYTYLFNFETLTRKRDHSNNRLAGTFTILD